MLDPSMQPSSDLYFIEFLEFADMPPRTRKRQVAQDEPDPEQPVIRRSNLREMVPPPEADLEVCKQINLILLTTVD